MRSVLGSISSTTHASAIDRLAFSTRTRARSPGTVPLTNTTKPSARPTPAPPWARESILTSSSSPRLGRGLWVTGVSAIASLCSQAAVAIDLTSYRLEAEEFLGAIDREYYLHYSGQQQDFDIEPIYDRHAGLFSRESVDALREAGAPPALVEFAVQGHIGRETKAESAELARCEAALQLEWDGKEVPFRSAAVVQANEPDPARRAALEAARNTLTETELNPGLSELLEHSHRLTRELGWASYAAMCQELSGIDLRALEAQTSAFLAETETVYEELVEPQLRRQIGLGFGELRRSDLPAFFRAPSLDPAFPQGRLVDVLT